MRKFLFLIPALLLFAGSAKAQAPAPHSATLSWAASPTAGVTYNVWRSTVSGGEDSAATAINVNLAPVAGLTYTDTTIVAGTTYFYVVRAINSAGVASGDSNEVMGQVQVVVPPPGAPLKLTITLQ